MVTAVSRAAVALFVVAVMLGGGLVPANQAHATAPVGSGLGEGHRRITPGPVDVSLVVDDVVRYDGCVSIPFEYSFDPSGFAYWEARMTFTDLSRRQMRSTYLFSRTDEASGSSEVSFCNDVPAGSWSADTYVQFFDDTGAEKGRGSAFDSFRVRETQTRTFFTLNDSTPDGGQLVAFRIRSEVEMRTRFGVNGLTKVALESLGSRGWTRLRGSLNWTNKYGVARVRVKWRSNAPQRIRAVTLETADSARSISQARRLR